MFIEHLLYLGTVKQFICSVLHDLHKNPMWQTVLLLFSLFRRLKNTELREIN